MEEMTVDKKTAPCPVEKTIAEKLGDSGRTISVAESCTGGLLSHRLTTIPGSTAYFTGGIIAYSNEVKISALGVSREMLMTAGAVSSEVAYAMCEGAISFFKTDVAISVTGIAGPGGGSPEKPVGTAYIGIVIGSKKFTQRIHSSGGRLLNKIHFSQTGLELLLQNL